MIDFFFFFQFTIFNTIQKEKRNEMVETIVLFIIEILLVLSSFMAVRGSYPSILHTITMVFVGSFSLFYFVLIGSFSWSIIFHILFCCSIARLTAEIGSMSLKLVETESILQKMKISLAETQSKSKAETIAMVKQIEGTQREYFRALEEIDRLRDSLSRATMSDKKTD